MIHRRALIWNFSSSVLLDSSRVCEANEWDVEWNTRRGISYLQATMNYFVYHISTIALYRQEKSTLLMNENKRIDNPRIKIVKCVGALKMKTCFESQKKKQYLGWFSVNKIFTKWISPYRQMESFRYTAKIGLWQVFQFVIFVLSREKCHYQGFSYLGFLPLLRKFESQFL